MPLLRLLVAALAAAFALSCGSSAPDFRCVDNGDCGEREACILEACEPVQCLTSSDCRIREYCDDRTYVCRAGCSADADCIAGEACDTATNTCEAYGCRDTQLDCGLGQYCSAVTGQCTRDPKGHCDRCTPDFWGTNVRGTCRDREAFCLTFDGADFYCLMECSQATDCPRGYECVNTGQDFNGNGRSDSICFGYCPLFYDKGWK
jgi:hypothetical protein